MPRTPTDKRQLILAAASKVFDAHGYAATTVEAVAAEAGVAKGSVYNYFQSKQDLFTSVFTDSLAVDEQRTLSDLSRQSSALAKLMLIFDHWYERFSHYQRLGRLVLECWLAAAREEGTRGDGALTGTFRQIYAVWRDRLAEIVTDGVASGEFRTDIEPAGAAAVIMAAFDGLTLQAILGVGIVVDEDFLARLKRGFLMALGAGAPRA